MRSFPSTNLGDYALVAVNPKMFQSCLDMGFPKYDLFRILSRYERLFQWVESREDGQSDFRRCQRLFTALRGRLQRSYQWLREADKLERRRARAEKKMRRVVVRINKRCRLKDHEILTKAGDDSPFSTIESNQRADQMDKMILQIQDDLNKKFEASLGKSRSADGKYWFRAFSQDWSIRIGYLFQGTALLFFAAVLISGYLTGFVQKTTPFIVSALILIMVYKLEGRLTNWVQGLIVRIGVAKLKDALIGVIIAHLLADLRMKLLIWNNFRRH